MTLVEGAGPTEVDEPSVPAADEPGVLVASILEQEEQRRAEPSPSATSTEVGDVDLPGVGSDAVPLRTVLREGGVTPVAVLSALVIVDSFDRAAFGVLTPEIQRSLDVGDLALGIIGAVGGLVAFAAAVPIGFLADRYRRWTLVGAFTVIAAVFAGAVGLVQNAWQLVLARIGGGMAEAHKTPVHGPLLVDTYQPEGRARVFAIHSGAGPASRLIGPGLAGFVAGVAGGPEGWRWAFIVLSIPALVLGLVAFFVREPARGRWEQEAVLGDELADPVEEAFPITLGAAFARLRKIDTFYYTMVGLGALGFAITTVPIYMNLILEERFGVGPTARGTIGTIAATGSVVGAVIAGVYGDRLFRRNPAWAMNFAGAAIAILGLSIPLEVYAPNIWVYLVVAWLTGVATGGAFVPLSPVLAAVIPYRLRSMGFALIGIYLSLIGGLGGAVIVGMLAESWGRSLAVATVGPTAALIGAALIARGSRFVRPDMEAAAADLIEEQEERERIRSNTGQDVVLQVRHLDFSYGDVQVLFDVDLDVREGEILALLGTNGAGKSTVLRAVSGLGHPDRGSVRFRGRTMTYADARTRVEAGIVQVPGGKAVFPSMTVAENLAVGAHTFIWDRERVDRRAAEVFELFPVLAERAHQRAGTLSGGERQMLGICKGLMLEPQLLLLDELTLGLAPVVVQEILPVLDRLKAEGMTIVIVEQSVNLALSVADRAVFMEKGRVRFEGSAADLLERDDLVRAVFLGSEGG